MNIAQITVSGNVGADPEINDVNGTKVANFSIAVNENYKDKSGNKVENTHWFRVEAWDGKQGGLVSNIIEPYVKKGSTVLIQGFPTQEKYTDKDGNEKRSFKVKLAGAGSLLRMASRSDNASNDEGQPQGNTKTKEELDDNIPF